MNRILNSIFLLILLSHGFLTVAQQTQTQTRQPLNYGFVSPNTREDQKLNEAIAAMNSTDEAVILKRAENLGCVVRARVRVFKSLGSWSDGAEQAILLRVRSDEASVRYLLARLGRDSHQKSILYFHPKSSGTSRIYLLKPKRQTSDLIRITETLERAGIVFRTLVPVGNKTWIYIVDPKRELGASVRNAAKRLRATVNWENGTAEFVGAEHVPEAKQIFEKEIADYETKNPKLPPTCDVQKEQ